MPKTLEKNYGKLHATEERLSVYKETQYSHGWDWGAKIATGEYIRERLPGVLS